jgi:nucleoid DNA-binding protein
MSETKRINRDEFARLLVAAGTVDTKVAGLSIVDTIFDIMKEQVVAGNEIAIPGFGKLSKYKRENGKYKAKFNAFEDFTAAVNA